MTDSTWFGGALEAVVLDIDADPDDAHRVVRPRLNGGLGVRGIGVPEQIRVVMKFRLPVDRRHVPLADWQRVVLAAARDWREEHRRAVRSDDLERRLVA